MPRSLSQLSSSVGSTSTVREHQLETVPQNGNNLEESKNKNKNLHVEPTRFPSLTFISQNNNLNNDRETTIKNANLKSELIENDDKNDKKKVKDTLFNNNLSTTTVSLQSSNPTNTTSTMIAGNLSPISRPLQKAGSINTLQTIQTIYTDANSTFEFDDSKPLNINTNLNINDGFKMLSPTDGNFRDDSHSVYQPSIYSANHENQNHYFSHHQKFNVNNQNPNIGKEDTESFIYNDRNSVDILSLNEHKVQRKLSNALNNPMLKENYSTIAGNTNTTTTTTTINNNNSNNSNDLDFLDSQSVATVITSHEASNQNQNLGQGPVSFPNKSPNMKRQQFYSNNNALSVSPKYSKVRQVSQKIFNNYNPNINMSNNNNSMSHPGMLGFSKINLQNKLRNNGHTQSQYFDHTDGIHTDLIEESPTDENTNSDDNDHNESETDNDNDTITVNGENINDNVNENETDQVNDFNDHTGFTDAESFLAKPYRKKNKNNVKPKYYSHKYTSPDQGNIHSKKNIQNNNIPNNLQHLDSQRLNLKVNNSNYTDYGSMKYTYFDSIDDYNLPNQHNVNFSDGDGGNGGNNNNNNNINNNNGYNYYTYDGSNSPHDYKSMYYRQNMFLKFILTSIYIFVLLIFLVSCLKIIIMKNFDNTLSNFEVTGLDNVLVSDEVLLLDINVKSTNTNFQDINIWNIDLDLFLVTDETNLNSTDYNDPSGDGKDITILLGNSNQFLTPLKFPGLLSLSTWSEVWGEWNNPKNIKPVDSRAQLKLYQPGKKFTYHSKALTHEQWLKILNSKFKIILRGNLKYSLPLVWQDEFISISTEIEIKN